MPTTDSLGHSNHDRKHEIVGALKVVSTESLTAIFEVAFEVAGLN